MGIWTLRPSRKCPHPFSHFRGRGNGGKEMWFWEGSTRRVPGNFNFFLFVNCAGSILPCLLGGFGLIYQIGATDPLYHLFRFDMHLSSSHHSFLWRLYCRKGWAFSWQIKRPALDFIVLRRNCKRGIYDQWGWGRTTTFPEFLKSAYIYWLIDRTEDTDTHKLNFNLSDSS